jgi:O-antigen ligase
MRGSLRRIPLLAATQAAIVLTIFLFALGSSSVPQATQYGSKLRWIALLMVLVLALVLLVARGGVVPDRRVGVLVALFGLIALVSSAWSVDPRLSVGRAGSFLVLLVITGALAASLANESQAIDAILMAVVLGATIVCLSGLIVLAWSPGDAMQYTTPARWKGLGQNPNTVPMLAALAAPLALRLLIESTRRRRYVGLICLASAYVTVVASGSRGALLASLGGLLVTAVLIEQTRLFRLSSVVALVAVFAVSVLANNALLRRVPAPSTATEPPSRTSPTPAVTSGRGASLGYTAASSSLPAMQDEIGSLSSGADHSSTFDSSGRIVAWRGAIAQAEKRPILGYGFGTEERVFVDRYYYFEGSRPENSYIGLFLQLGIVGVIGFLAIVLALVPAVTRGIRSSGARSRVAAASGAVIAGLVLAVGQSYVYAVGNIATVSFWLCVAMLVASAPAPRVAQRYG